MRRKHWKEGMSLAVIAVILLATPVQAEARIPINDAASNMIFDHLDSMVEGAQKFVDAFDPLFYDGWEDDWVNGKGIFSADSGKGDTLDAGGTDGVSKHADLEGALLFKLDSPYYYRDEFYNPLDGQNKEVVPFTSDGRTLIPIRCLAEAVGAVVGWDDSTQAVTIQFNGKTIRLTIGSKTAYMDGKTMEMEVAPTTRWGRTVVPLRFISEAFGFDVEWQGEHNLIGIFTDIDFTALDLAQYEKYKEEKAKEEANNPSKKQLIAPADYTMSDPTDGMRELTVRSWGCRFKFPQEWGEPVITDQENPNTLKFSVGNNCEVYLSKTAHFFETAPITEEYVDTYVNDKKESSFFPLDIEKQQARIEGIAAVYGEDLLNPDYCFPNYVLYSTDGAIYRVRLWPAAPREPYMEPFTTEERSALETLEGQVWQCIEEGFGQL